jgi:hypothetical protein
MPLVKDRQSIHVSKASPAMGLPNRDQHILLYILESNLTMS